MPNPTDQRSAGWVIARPWGIPVVIARSWLLIAVLIALLFGPVVRSTISVGAVASYLVALGFAVLLLLSVMAHEAAHAVVARRQGHHVTRVVADFWGGHTAYEAGESTPGQSAAVAVAGPLANAGLALLGWAATGVLTGDVVGLLAWALTFANAFVAVVNLLPGMPLDGGFLTEALVWRLTGSHGQGTAIAGWIGRGLVVLLVIWAVGQPLLAGQRPDFLRILWVAVLGAFLWSGASAAVRSGAARQRLERALLRDILTPAIVLAPQATVADAYVQQRPGRALLIEDGPSGRSIVDPAALERVPRERRESTPIHAVARPLPASARAVVVGERDVSSVLSAVQASRAPVIVVIGAHGEVRGVVYVAALAPVLERH